MKYSIFFTVCIIAVLSAETLFEVKDASNNKVLDVSTDGLRIMNEGDTLMVISSEEIKANIGTSNKGLSRSFSVTTTQSKGTSSDLMKVTSDSTRIWVKDAGKGFQVASMNSLARAVADTSYMSIDNYNSLVGLGAGYRINPNVAYTYGNKYNTMYGYQAGFNTFGVTQISEASYNVFLGYKSGFTNTTGSGNIYIGNQSGYSGVNNSNNTYLGTYSGQQTTGSYNTFLGYSSGRYTSTGIRNTFVGQTAGSNNTSGSYNAYLGAGSGGSYNGSNNVFLGYGSATWYGGGSGNSNVMIGYQAGSNSTSTASFSGANNVMVGYQAGLKTITGSFSGTGNVLLGYQAGSGSQKYSNKLFIENSNADSLNALIWGDFYNNELRFNTSSTQIVHPSGTSNGLYIQSTYNGNTDSWHFYQYSTKELALFYNLLKRGDFDITSGVYTSVSDRRFKKNIKDLRGALDKVLLLDPKRYNFISQNDGEREYIGLIAQDVEKLFPEFVHYTEEDDTYTIDYAGLSVVAIQAIKEQEERIKRLEDLVQQLLEK